ncbi:MAG: hypothetical protein IJP97_04530 [Synergistaceae bacterium]|nr:hypothetical protein [Synergistaceae bacterium]MBQ9628285.1 hypothetical protein [Synergistaceae bacterium]MBR0069742.1 hypothetical protein [Synergistaceae bacterium]MBR0249904.1 hypothetical protein [Synergistaceae bacterium]
MRRKRVDWDAEIQKTEKIRRKGILMSILSFAMAAAFIFGMSKSTGNDIKIPGTVLIAVIFCVSCFVLRAVMKYRSKRRKRDERDSD